MALFKKMFVPIFSAITALITSTSVIAQTAAQKIDSGDTAWMLTATALVLLMTFAIITPALIVGAFADRMKFSAMLWFTSAWLLVVYAPVTHWV